MNPQDFIEAARVPPMLAPQSFGLWTIQRAENLPPLEHIKVGFSSLTMLRRMTNATMHQPPGETVMEDGLTELRRHLPIWLAARGRVLVTGLGLGCVVRGLLANDRLEHVDVVEIDEGILRVVGRLFEREPRVTLHYGDALTFPTDKRWDYAWHDVCEPASSEGPSLHCLHANLLIRFADCCAEQGAWQFPRMLKRLYGHRMRLIG